MKFLIIGLGSAGQRHARVIREIYPHSYIYVYRGSHKMGLISEDLLDLNLDIDPVFYYDLIEIKTLSEIDFDINLTIIATPPDSHFFYSTQVWNISSKILIEKPLSLQFSESNVILKKAIEDKKIVFTGYQHIFNPIFIDLEEIFRSQNWKRISCEFYEPLSGMNPFRSFTGHHLMSPEKGNALLTLSHEIDFLIRLIPKKLYKLKTELKSSRDYGLAYDICSINAEFFYDELNSTKISINLGFSNLSQKSRKGFFESDISTVEWDLLNKTLTHRGEVKYFNFSADSLIRREIEYLMQKSVLDEELENHLRNAVYITKMNHDAIFLN